MRQSRVTLHTSIVFDNRTGHLGYCTSMIDERDRIVLTVEEIERYEAEIWELVAESDKFVLPWKVILEKMRPDENGRWFRGERGRFWFYAYRRAMKMMDDMELQPHALPHTALQFHTVEVIALCTENKRHKKRRGDRQGRSRR